MWDSTVVGALRLYLVSFGRFDVPSRNALLMHEGREERKDVLGRGDGPQGACTASHPWSELRDGNTLP